MWALCMTLLVVTTLQSDTRLPLGMPLLPIRAEDLVMIVPSGKIVLPAAAITVVHYLVLILLLAIVGKIAVSLIGHGSSLLREGKDDARLPLSK